jgi:Regulator of chromosome condensation (RCC1) repeat
MGHPYSCVARTDGGVDCWGFLRRGLREEFVRAPGVEVLPPETAARLVVGHGTVCGIDEAATLRCVGENASGDLGIGGPTPLDATPLLIVPDVLDASISDSLLIVDDSESPYYWRRPSCLVRTSGALECWGYNGFGQVGDGTYEDRTLPTGVGGLGPVETVDVGPTHTCAIDADGAAWCWGDNTMGQLGDGTDTSSPVPVRVLLDEPAIHISVAEDISCAQVTSGRTFCWGSDLFSILGRSDPPPYIDRPQRVIFPP